MWEGVALAKLTLEYETLTPEQALRRNPLELAYIGDTVYDLYVRAYVLEKSTMAVKGLHRQAVEYVNCGAQASAMERLLPLLSPEEVAAFKRGRNAHTRAPRNADPGAYACATGLEALVGFLFLTGQAQRLQELIAVALSGQAPQAPIRKEDA